MEPSYDCVIIGGGPAGATAAAILADHGRRTLVLERERFPRFHIGESLMPETYWVFRRLGVLDALKASPFVTKESVQFVSASGKASRPYYFFDRNPHECSRTWQVRRDEFDKLMLDNARAHGAEVIEGAQVRSVVLEGDRAVGVDALVDGAPRRIGARVVVDASGQATLLARQLGIRRPDPNLKKASIFAHYRGGLREPGRDEGATLVLHTRDRTGWFWYLPLHDDIVSVGIVADPKHLFHGRGDDPGTTLDKEIGACPAVQERLARAVRVTEVRVTSDLSYRAERMAGDGWVLIGDAFGFIDPVYSSGVMLALKSGEAAADAIHDALEAGDTSGARLSGFAGELTAGMHRLRQLVYAFYDRDLSFGRFIKAYPRHADTLVRLLIGDVFTDDVDGIFRDLARHARLPDAVTP